MLFLWLPLLEFAGQKGTCKLSLLKPCKWPESNLKGGLPVLLAIELSLVSEGKIYISTGLSLFGMVLLWLTLAMKLFSSG